MPHPAAMGSATASAAAAAAAATFTRSLHHYHHPSSLAHQPILFDSFWLRRLRLPHRCRHHHHRSKFLFTPPHSSFQAATSTSTRMSSSTCDPELRSVLELATHSELLELHSILFGPSYFSPLLKSITKKADVDYFMIGEDPREREDFISILGSRFFYLAADARSTLRGWRPSYRDVLLGVRKKLKVHCSAKLSTEDLEVEIFLHLLHEYSSEEKETYTKSKERPKTSEGRNNLERGLSQWKIQAGAALMVGVPELRQIILKGGWILTLGKFYDLLARRLSGKMLLEVAKYQIKNDMMRKGGQLAAINLEARAALLAAKQGLAGAASKYVGLRSMTALLGPMMWGTFLADMVIQMLGTDYARILRAIYAFAQIRIMHTYRLPSDSSEEDEFC